MTELSASQDGILNAVARWKAGDKAEDIAAGFGMEPKGFDALRRRMREFFPRRSAIMTKKAGPAKRWTPGRLDTAIAMWAEGKTIVEIAAALEVSVRIISDFASRHREDFPVRVKAPVAPPPRAVRNTDRSYVHKVADGVLVSLPVVRGYCEARAL